MINYNFEGIKVSTVQYDEGPVGCTFIFFEKKAQIFIDKRGGARAYLSVESNNNLNFMDGVCIAGGSILGLEATTGIMAETLKQSNYSSYKKIAGSMIGSHNLKKNKIYPDKALGRFAYQNLQYGNISTGNIGGAASASIGQGASFFEYPNKVKILAVVVINAIGNIYKDNNIIKRSGFFDKKKKEKDSNTTITVLITNLILTSFDLEQMSKQCHSGMAINIRPFHTLYDGDVFYSCSTQELNIEQRDIELIHFFMKCSEVIEQAIFNASKY